MSTQNVESGRVVAIEDDALWVETIQQSTCQACSQKSGCGQYALSKWQPGKRNQIRVPLGDFVATDFNLGDYVQLSVVDGLVLKSSLIVYILPLVMMILGAAVFNHFWSSDLAAVVGALAGLSFGFGAVKWHSVLSKDDPRLQPTLVGVENRANCYIPVKVVELSE